MALHEVRAVIVETPTCIVCRRTAFVEVDGAGFERWVVGEVNILDAFPTLDADQRELLISGTHAQCWAAIHGPDEGDA